MPEKLGIKIRRFATGYHTIEVRKEKESDIFSPKLSVHLNKHSAEGEQIGRFKFKVNNLRENVIISNLFPTIMGKPKLKRKGIMSRVLRHMLNELINNEKAYYKVNTGGDGLSREGEQFLKSCSVDPEQFVKGVYTVHGLHVLLTRKVLKPKPVKRKK